MMSIKNSKIFKEDYANLQRSILEISDENIKNELTKLLLELSAEVAIIDMHHDSVSITGKMPDALRDSRSKIASIRKNIDKKISDYQTRQTKN